MAEGGFDDVTFENPTFDGSYDVLDPLLGDDMTMDRLPQQRQTVTQMAVDEYYRELNQKPEFVDYTRFRLKDGKLIFKNDKGDYIRLEKINPTHGTKYYSLSTLGSNIHRQLGITKPTINKKALQNIEETMPKHFELIPMRDLPSATKSLSQELQEAETSFIASPLTQRELIALDRTLQTIQGELTNNLAKLGTLDEDIQRQQGKIAQADEDPSIDKKPLERRLQDLYIERQARLEVLNVNKNKLKNQFTRIKDTIVKITHEDETLGEKIKTLFREQGVTLASILTALGFIISTIAIAVGGGGGKAGGGGGAKDWIKKQLNNFANLLKELAQKALVALPGVIGSFVNWLLSTLSKTASWLASNLWALALAGGGVIISYINHSRIIT